MSKGGLPVLKFNWADEAIRQIAANIWHAQQAGWPAVLTYDRTRTGIERRKQLGAKRYSAMTVTLDDVRDLPGAAWLVDEIKQNGVLQVPVIRDPEPGIDLFERDEYPFACTREHGGKVWIGNVLPAQNRLQGRMIRAFLREHHAGDGFRFEVRVVNYPEA